MQTQVTVSSVKWAIMFSKYFQWKPLKLITLVRIQTDYLIDPNDNNFHILFKSTSIKTNYFRLWQFDHVLQMFILHNITRLPLYLTNNLSFLSIVSVFKNTVELFFNKPGYVNHLLKVNINYLGFVPVDLSYFVSFFWQKKHFFQIWTQSPFLTKTKPKYFIRNTYFCLISSI